MAGNELFDCIYGLWYSWILRHIITVCRWCSEETNAHTLRADAHWNNKWINYSHSVLRSSMECANEKSTQLARCRMCHSQWQRQTQRRRNGLEHSNFPHENFQLFVVLIIVFAMCICSIAFDDEWQELTEFRQQRRRQHATVICKRIQLWVLILWLFTFPARRQPATDDGRGTVFMGSERAFLILFLFPVEMVVCWWTLMVAPHFSLVDKTQRHKNGK